MINGELFYTFPKNSLVHCQADFDWFVGVQSEALLGRTKLRFELQRTRQNRIDKVLVQNLPGFYAKIFF
jgi:hypothetical protein